MYGRRRTTHLLKAYARSGATVAAIYVDVKRTTHSKLVADLARAGDVSAHMIHILPRSRAAHPPAGPTS